MHPKLQSRREEKLFSEVLGSRMRVGPDLRERPPRNGSSDFSVRSAARWHLRIDQSMNSLRQPDQLVSYGNARDWGFPLALYREGRSWPIQGPSKAHPRPIQGPSGPPKQGFVQKTKECPPTCVHSSVPTWVHWSRHVGKLNSTQPETQPNE